MTTREVEKTLKILNWTKGCIEKGIGDLNNLLTKMKNEQTKQKKKWMKWNSYREVQELLEEPHKSGYELENAIGRLFYAMSMNNYPVDEVKYLIGELEPRLTKDSLRQVLERAGRLYPELLFPDLYDEPRKSEKKPTTKKLMDIMDDVIQEVNAKKKHKDETLDELMKGWEESKGNEAVANDFNLFKDDIGMD